MKSMILAGALIVSSISYASGFLDYFNTVTSSEVTQKICDDLKKTNTWLNKIEHTATYRCPGCYDFTLSFQGTNGDAGKVVVRTNLDLESNVVNVKEIKRELNQ